MCDLLLQPLPFCIVMLPLSEPVQSHACALQGVATAETFSGRMDVVRACRPRFVILENVQTLANAESDDMQPVSERFWFNGSRLMQGVCDYYMI